MTTTVVEPKMLTQADRCDRCAAQALIRVILPYGELLFCGHHYAKHASSLKTQAIAVEDFTEQLIGPSS